MSVNIRFPNITARDEAEQLVQIRSYLHQLVEQLNWVLSTIESGSVSSGNAVTSSGDMDAATVNELKAMIFKATNTLNEYYDKVNRKLADYVMKTDYDAYKLETSQRFDDLGNQYVSKTDFDAYKQENTEAISGLATQYVSQETFDTHVQETAETLDRLDDKYVLKTAYDAYVLANNQNIADLMESIASLNQRIDSMQETGG